MILNYNGRKYIQNLFHSLYDQSFQDFEIIFVDNCSNDDSVPLLRQILTQEPFTQLNVKLVLNETNLGYCRGNNVGIEHAAGEYVVFLNNDTYVSATWLEMLIEVMSSFVIIGACQSRIISAQTKEIQADGWMLDQFGSTKALVISHCENIFSTLPFYGSGASLIVRRDILRIAEGFDPVLFSGDFDLCWRIRLLGYDIAVAHKSICYHYGQVATRSLFNSVELQFSSDKEFMRVFIKNLSSTTMCFRLCLLLFRMAIVSVHHSFILKNPIYFLSPLEAVFWNLRVLNDTLLARQRNEKYRKVTYAKIESKILRCSIDISRKLETSKHLHRLFSQSRS